MTNAEYVSPDGLLRFLVQTADDGVVCLGFDGFLWHRHPDELTEGGRLTEQQAVERYVSDLLESRAVIAVSRTEEGRVVGARVTDDPASETLHLSPGMSVELRYWDGTQWDDTRTAKARPTGE
jgi:hypothetical protein